MPFDANLVLADDTADWTYANLVTSNYGTPTLTSKNSGGFVVLDIKKTGAKGMAAVLIIDEAGLETDDALVVLLQASDNSDFSEEIETLAEFDILGATHGVILGNECPCTVVRKFTTVKRYLRIDASCNDGDNFHTCWCVLAPWPFHVL